jgi:hypothetical protein
MRICAWTWGRVLEADVDQAAADQVASVILSAG